MSEEFLNGAAVIAIFQQMHGERVPQHMPVDRLAQSDCSCGLFDGSLSHEFVPMMLTMLLVLRVQANL
jgi:hypothetical protein